MKTKRFRLRIISRGLLSTYNLSNINGTVTSFVMYETVVLFRSLRKKNEPDEFLPSINSRYNNNKRKTRQDRYYQREKKNKRFFFCYLLQLFCRKK